MDVLIKNAQVYNGSHLQKADVLIKNGCVEKIGNNITAKAVKTLDATGCLLSAGFTDLHVHLREPGYEKKETMKTGTLAAAAGGFTTVCSMPNLAPVPDNLQNLAPQLKAIEEDASVRVLPYGAITVGEKGDCLADMEVLASFVAGFSDDGRGVQNEEMMRRAMQQAAKQNSMIVAHCEEESLLPQNGVCVQENSGFAKKHGYVGHSNQSEAAEVARNICLAEETGCRLHICHISAKESIDLVRAAKAKGLAVSCEVTPHNLLLSCDDIKQDDGRFKMNPPLRGHADVQAAVQGLIDGTIEAIATDHAPHTIKEKEGGFEKAMNGVVGLEVAFPVLYTKLVRAGVLSLETLLQRMTTGPRMILGEEAEGLTIGEHANFTLINLEEERAVNPDEFKTKGRATPFEGWSLQGWPMLTACNGRVVFERDKLQYKE